MKIKFNKKAESVWSDNPHYDILEGGFDDLIKDTDRRKELSEAIQLLNAFLAQAEDKNLIEIG